MHALRGPSPGFALSEARTPVPRPSSTVRNNDDLDLIAADPIDEAERVEREDVAAGVPSMARPHERILRDGVDGMPRFFAKGMRSGVVPSGVPVIGRFRLLRGSGMEPDGRRSHSAPI